MAQDLLSIDGVETEVKAAIPLYKGDTPVSKQEIEAAMEDVERKFTKVALEKNSSGCYAWLKKTSKLSCSGSEVVRKAAAELGSCRKNRKISSLAHSIFLRQNVLMFRLIN